MSDTVGLLVERAALEALLRDCYLAIYAAAGSDAGLDSMEGVALLDRIEDVLPDLKVKREADWTERGVWGGE